MKANQDVIIRGEKVVLVPYEAEHVPTYHNWMLDEELRALTASEPLTLEEEYEMQRKWREDEDKLTFIILAASAEIQDSKMIGDVNIFLKGDIPSGGGDPNQDEDDFEAEVEIMIAEKSYRRQGHALESLQLLLSYATGGGGPFGSQLPVSLPKPIPPTRLVARISTRNTASIALFEKLGFVVTKVVEVFGEVKMRWKVRRTHHRLHVQNPYFNDIQSGIKTLEGRLRDEEVCRIAVGDVVIFYTDDQSMVHTRVTAVHRFHDFEEMLSGGRLSELLPSVQTMARGLEIYRGFPGYAEKETVLGAVAFRLQLISGAS